VEVPKKMVDAAPLEIRYDEGAVRVNEAVSRKIRLL
jgi:hypothetical protein